MRWYPRGYGGTRRDPDRVKQEGWHDHGLLAVSIDDPRLTWPEQELVRQLGPPLSGKLSPALIPESVLVRRAGQDNELAYSPERKAAVLAKMLPPNNMPLGQLAKEEGISVATLAKWRAEARAKGRLLPDANVGPEGWTSEDKLAAVIETASMNEAELGEYCRRRGIYREQLVVWREACARANDWERAATSRIARETRDDKKRIQQLERELARKEKALAEAAALMILRKKAEAIWGPEGGVEE